MSDNTKRARKTGNEQNHTLKATFHNLLSYLAAIAPTPQRRYLYRLTVRGHVGRVGYYAPASYGASGSLEEIIFTYDVSICDSMLSDQLICILIGVLIDLISPDLSCKTVVPEQFGDRFSSPNTQFDDLFILE
jgi:hypothetical protein